MAESHRVDEAAHARLAAVLSAAGLDGEEVEHALSAYADGDASDLLRQLLIAQLWDAVLADAPSATSVAEWPGLGERGFPFLDGPAAQRLLETGANPRDLDAVVRSAQVWTVYNVLNVMDAGGPAPVPGLDPSVADELGWAVVASPRYETPPGDLGALHSSFEERDPTGRHGAPSRRTDSD